MLNERHTNDSRAVTQIVLQWYVKAFPMAQNQLSQIFEIKINKTALKRHCHASFNVFRL